MFKAIVSGVTGIALLCLSSAVAAPASKTGGATLIRNVVIFDATGQKPFKADVEIRDGRFSAIGKKLPKKRGTKVIEGKGLSLLPGLTDVHVHWTGMGGISRAETATQMLESGVTTSTDFHSAPESFGPKRVWHEQLISPHVVFTARTATPGGHGADWGDENMTRLATTPREGKAIVNAVAEYQPQVIKVFADGWRYGSGINNASINIDALAAIVQEAKALGLPVVTHTVTVDGAKTAAEAGVTAIVHAVQDRNLDEDLITTMLENGVYYAPTLAVYEPRPDKTGDSSEAQMQLVTRRQEASRYNLQRIAAAGIPIAVGTDSGIGATPFGESTLRELELLVDFGLSPDQALTAGTANSARLLGLGDDRGTIEVGKRADFVLVRGEPWNKVSDFRNIDAVFVDGEQVVKGGTLIRAQNSDVPAAVEATPVIDDFERTEGLTAGGAARLADVDSGFPRSVLIAQTVVRDVGGMALQLSADLSDKEAPKAFIVLPLSPGSVVPSDATRFKGVRFDARGDGGAYKVELVSKTGAASDEFVAGSAWQTLDVPFSAVEGEEFSPEALYSVKLGASRAGGEIFWLEIDNVEFY
ncbi:MAG: amidohydrolase family protein [Hyphomonas sp.]|uniref:amidohydrolase family protein n=1 Tax=Hyphomonas sp. TaxID=87 RepID=UPI0017CFA3E4|nr:amidohydrolase family protein [Hyphomonas sp.]MBA3067786.1 amidohydrolase family protein [Hyphomonas sp.]MBU3920175.1 amidohydrolase family protein [Alphaproteobacteria bacterium]MBU4062126.1 amidohydrolase family protein [Alphaproteobacteria bacterium]MBU4165561.1 amidohydrolase family protein [Alphaproteobacteria bacterium]